jgi:hypothetical protein
MKANIINSFPAFRFIVAPGEEVYVTDQITAPTAGIIGSISSSRPGSHGRQRPAGRLQSDAEPPTTGVDNSTEQEALACQLPDAVASRR